MGELRPDESQPPALDAAGRDHIARLPTTSDCRPNALPQHQPADLGPSRPGHPGNVGCDQSGEARMRRREFAKLVAATALWPTVANAQKPMPVIGFLSSRAPSESALHVAAFLKGLSEAGYVVAQNVVIEYRW